MDMDIVSAEEGAAGNFHSTYLMIDSKIIALKDNLCIEMIFYSLLLLVDYFQFIHYYLNCMEFSLGKKKLE